MRPDTLTRQGLGEPLYTGQPAGRGMADLRQRLAGRHETRRHTAGGVHPRPPAPETLRSFGHYERTTAYTPAGQLQSQHLNSLQYDRDYTWNDNGELIRISSPRHTRSYSYSNSAG